MKEKKWLDKRSSPSIPISNPSEFLRSYSPQKLANIYGYIAKTILCLPSMLYFLREDTGILKLLPCYSIAWKRTLFRENKI